MSDYPTNLTPESPTPQVPRRPERETDPAPAPGGKEPPTLPGDWMNLHPTLAPASKPVEPPPQERKKTPSGSYIAIGGPLSAQTADSASTTALLPKMVGHYEIIKELGRGGMGVVYLAKDSRLKRPVALKMILTEAYADRDQRERFHAEAQAVAQLKHPNIVQIYEIGEYEGHPYLALEYFDGGNMRQVCQGQPQEIRWAAQVVKTLAEAMEYAHHRGVVHRDLKPANVLLQKDDDNTKNRQLRWGQRFPASSYVRHSSVKITDFGLAKFITETERPPEAKWQVYDLHADAVGTPQYMAPEQAQGERGHAGPAADIYALGAILYDLLTGRPPFDGPTPRDTILRVLTEEALPPSRLQPRIPRDLETICLKCLQKEPSKRYASASDLVADLRRFLTGEPIMARRTIFIQKGVKWARRRPGVAGLLFVMMLLSVAALGVIGWAMRELAHQAEGERQARGAETKARLQAEDQLSAAERARAMAEQESVQAQALAEQERLLRQKAERRLYAFLFTQALGKEELHRAEALRHLEGSHEEFTEDYRGWEWHYLAQPPERRHAMVRPAQASFPATTVSLAVTSDGHTLLLTADPQKKLLTFRDGEVLKVERPLPEGNLHAAALCGKGRMVALAVWDSQTRKGQLLVGEMKEKVTLRSWDLPQIPARLTWDAEGKRLGVLCVDLPALGAARLALVDPTAGTLSWCTQPAPQGQPLLALSGQGKELLVSPPQGRDAALWNLRTGQLQPHPLGVTGIAALQISPDGQRIAVADTGGLVSILDAVTGQPLFTLRDKLPLSTTPHAARPQLAFSPNGRYLAALASDGTVLLWDSGRQIGTTK